MRFLSHPLSNATFRPECETAKAKRLDPDKVLAMSRALEQLLSILDIETLEENLFRGLSPQVGWQRVFGGQVIGQALVAAQPHRGRVASPHSLHAYFLRAGDPSVPIIYEVDRIRDGGSFSTRRVVAIQHGQAIFSMAASFQKSEEGGLQHQIKMPDVPPPEALPSEAELKACLIDRAAAPGKGLLGARAADRDPAGRPLPIPFSREPRSLPASVDQGHRASSATTLPCTNACSPMRQTSRCSTRR